MKLLFVTFIDYHYYLKEFASKAILPDSLEWMGLYSFALAMLVILICIGILWGLNRWGMEKWARSHDRKASKYLFGAFCFVWLLGFMVYDTGMYTGDRASLYGNAPMAMLHASLMFLFQSDVSAIHERFHDSWLFMMFFALAHFLAALVSLAFVIKYFGYSIVAGLRLLKASRFSHSRATTYVFWGLSNAAYRLASDINAHHNAIGDKNYRIVVVRTNADIDDSKEHNGVERWLKFLSFKSKDFERLVELKCLTANCFASLPMIDDGSLSSGDNDLLKGRLRLAAISRLLLKKTSRNLHFFVLTNDEQYNLHAVSALRNDTTLQAFAATGRATKLYCHARYNSLNRVVEDERPGEHIEVRLVDSSRLVGEWLKQQDALLPVNHVVVETDATVSSPFHSLVVGMGEYGKEVVRFLYEYGAFVASGGGSDHVTRSAFHCDVVDIDMGNKAGTFMAHAPAMHAALAGDTEDGDAPLVTLRQDDCHSDAFFERLRSQLPTLNYVVLATEDDKTNISLAVTIFRMAVRYRNNLDRFTILVRASHDDECHTRRVAAHYNRQWAAERHGIASERMRHQNTIKVDDEIDSPIVVFGLDKDIFTYDIVVGDKLTRLAAQFKERHAASLNAMKVRDGKMPDKVETWDDEFNDLMQLADPWQGFVPTYTAVARLRRTQRQNRANSLHTRTKVLLAQKALGDEKFASLPQQGLVRHENEIAYHNVDGTTPDVAITRVLDVLAQTEHLRWNASHELLGYKRAANTDEARLEHNCLVNWEELPPHIQSYDYNVVDITLGLVSNS